MPSGHRGLSFHYGVDRAALAPKLVDAFVELSCDDETRAWIDAAFTHPNGKARLFVRELALRVMSDYDANALFDTHDMRVLGPAQWAELLGARRGGRLLDVGAGDGRVTATLADRFDEVVATETAHRMAERLRERGFACHEVDLVASPLPDDRAFDVVSLLNVIDRTPRPYTLLERARDLARPDGRVIVAVPLPISAHVHAGAKTVDADERLPSIPRTWEPAANALAELCFDPLGLRVEALTRAPYLCRGAAERPVVQLDDAVFVLRRA
jgi:SAM-dependent methyltransferase